MPIPAIIAPLAYAAGAALTVGFCSIVGVRLGESAADAIGRRAAKRGGKGAEKTPPKVATFEPKNRPKKSLHQV